MIDSSPETKQPRGRGGGSVDRTPENGTRSINRTSRDALSALITRSYVARLQRLGRRRIAARQGARSSIGFNNDVEGLSTTTTTTTTIILILTHVVIDVNRLINHLSSLPPRAAHSPFAWKADRSLAVSLTVGCNREEKGKKRKEKEKTNERDNSFRLANES